jgi:hypothetical protein
MPFPDRSAYEELIYGLSEHFPSIQSSTLVLATIGPTLAKVEGQISFRENIILDVWELVDLDERRIRNYSYEIYRAGEKIAWYDPFEHLDVPELASTFPHHMHIEPDIKHHRVPSPGISFEHPNLPFLIQEIERTLLSRSM